MISLKAIQTSFTPIPERESFRKTRLVLSLCKSNTSDNSDQETQPPKGDSRKQELLVRIAMLQTQKVRLTDYLDERSAYLNQFAEEANAEIDQIGENALRELDEAGARIMGNIESRMQAFEESLELNKLEIEENEKKVAEFEDQIEKDRNEGLFFKNLRQKTPVDKAKAKEEAERIRDLTEKSAGSVIRRNIYLALIGLIVVGIADASISSTSDWRKVAVLGVILHYPEELPSSASTTPAITEFEKYKAIEKTNHGRQLTPLLSSTPWPFLLVVVPMEDPAQQ